MSNKKAVNVGVELQGFYTLKTHTADGTETQSVGPFLNLILDSGLDSFGELSPASLIDGAMVGSGSTPPSAGDGSLVAEIARQRGGTYTPTINQDGLYVSFRRSIQFLQGAAAGNISEVAVYSVGDDLFSRSLVKNAEGVPIALTVQDNEFLTVEYELRVNQPTQDFNFTVDGRNVVMRASNISNSWSNNFQLGYTRSDPVAYLNGVLGGVTESVSATQSDNGTITHSSYFTGSYSRSAALNFSILEANFSISAIRYFHGFTFWQFSIDPPINKTNEDELTIDVSLTWARAGELPV